MVGVGVLIPDISIHALREEGDTVDSFLFCNITHFYPRPPRGGRPQRFGSHMILMKFLSTPSARRATRSSLLLRCRQQISIHALREEGDLSALGKPVLPIDFYPRPPRGGRRGSRGNPMTTRWISIHALREEGDVTEMLHHLLHRNFYPRPPRGGRQPILERVPQILNISIHALREEGDDAGGAGRQDRDISIHALREEGDFQRLQRHCS